MFSVLGCHALWRSIIFLCQYDLQTISSNLLHGIHILTLHIGSSYSWWVNYQKFGETSLILEHALIPEEPIGHTVSFARKSKMKGNRIAFNALYVLTSLIIIFCNSLFTDLVENNQDVIIDHWMIWIYNYEFILVKQFLACVYMHNSEFKVPFMYVDVLLQINTYINE